jgi:hypothetical protein
VLLGWTLLVAAIAAGTAERFWYVFHRPLNSDEAIVGLMAREVLHGHFSAFYWGQVYGGSLEPILTAPFVAPFGASTITLGVIEVALSAGAAILTWRVARRLVRDAWVAAAVGAVLWIAPQTAVSNATFIYGFRGVTLLLGLATLLLTLRIIDGRQDMVDFVTLGVVAGLGWWNSPEVMYYIVPSAFLLAQAAWQRRRSQDPLLSIGRVVAAIGGAVVGALPWLWANINSRLRSLRLGSFAVPPHSVGFLGRLRNFFRYGLPMLFSLRRQATGAWLGGVVGRSLAVVVLAVTAGAVVACLFKAGRPRAFGAGALALPLLSALSPGTWFWQDGRYVSSMAPLLLLVIALGTEIVVAGLGHRKAMARVRNPSVSILAFAPIALGLCALSLWNFLTFVAPGTTLTAWSRPDKPTGPTVIALESSGVTAGYADYWVAYRLDLLSGERLRFTVAMSNPDRWRSVDRQVRASPSAAWLFVAPTRVSVTQFGSAGEIQGPNSLPETSLLAYLAASQIPYRVVHAGLVEAVIPGRNVPPEALGPAT